MSFCVHALHRSGLLVVPDTTEDARFATHPLVTAESGIRFYAGAPLTTPEGETLGTLCVIDRVPRALTADQQQALAVLSRQVMTRLELHRQTLELSGRERLLSAVIEAEPEWVCLLGSRGQGAFDQPGGAPAPGGRLDRANPRSRYPADGCQRDRAAFQNLIDRVFQGESDRLEFRLTGLKGTDRWMEIHAVPLFGARGGITDS